MAKDKTKSPGKDDVLDPFEGFKNLTEQVIPGLAIEKDLKQDDAEDLVEDEEVIEPVKKKTESKKKVVTEEDEVVEDEEEEIEDKSKTKKKETKKSLEDDIEEEISKSVKKDEDVEFDEKEYVEPFFDILSEELGWEFEEGEFKPSTITEFKDYIGKVIDENSVPQYSSEIVERLDKYVANGGDPAKFMQVNFGEVDYGKMDVTKADNQKRVLRDYYKAKGFTEAKIDKHIERLSDLNDLESEAKDALEELKTEQETGRKNLEKNQEKARQKEADEYRKYVSTTKDYIEKTENISGLKISKKDKEELLPYIFQVGKDGKTQQQKDYENNPIEYMVATAYFYKHKDELKKRFENGTISNATERFKQKQAELKAKQSKNKSDYPNESVESEEDWLSALTKGIAKPK